ncbi:exosortase/archaeosortase family protein [Neorhizobium sp. R1-B]|nr:exosortase/archaeosortase family protein [Neorhizobium sp. R1-B]
MSYSSAARTDPSAASLLSRATLLLEKERLGPLYSTLVLCAFGNAVFEDIRKVFVEDGVVSALLTGGGVHPVLLFSVLWVAWALWKMPLESRLPLWAERLVIGLVALLLYLPLTWFSWVALTILGGRVLLSDRKLGILSIYLTVPKFWGLILVMAIGTPVLTIDAYVTALAAGYESSANFVVPTDGNDPVLILWACSSFHGISYMLLAWLAYSVVNKVSPLRGLNWLAAGIAGVVLINWMRLFAMIRFMDLYEPLHDGVAGEVVGLLTTFWIIGLASMGRKSAVRA